jgi:glyoxylase-like metal-dependent hydrolase (beta-lactamase superfamily II)
VKVRELAPGLWYWLAPHPKWKPGNDWPGDVLCVYYEARDAVVLIDPLLPRGEEDAFWQALDGDVERVGKPVRVLLTAPWHERDAAGVADRYGAETGGEPLPTGVEAFAAGPPQENQVAYLIRPHETLVVAEFFQGTRDGLRVAPSPADPRPEALRSRLRELLDLPIGRVLVAHGPPVLADGREAIRRALESP